MNSNELAIHDATLRELAAEIPLGTNDSETALAVARELLAEVRRLRGLIQQAEWGSGYQERAQCPWCGAESPCAHEPSCAAFGSSVVADGIGSEPTSERKANVSRFF